MSKVLHRIHFNSPIGTICMEDDGEALTALYLDADGKNSDDSESELLKRAKSELLEYFAGKRMSFDIPLHMQGSAFQIQVWNALRRIPYGTTCSYSELAEAVGNPKACRAVGGANNRNQILIMVPCHRVIGKNGGLVGFGAGLQAKEYLLELEKKYTGKESSEWQEKLRL